MLFKNILKSLREERDLSQKQVADACGISSTCICQLETGARNPTGSTLYALADFFQCSVDYLLGREDDYGVISVQTKKSDETLSPYGKELLEIFNSLEKEHQLQILEYARYFAARSGTTKKKA